LTFEKTRFFGLLIVVPSGFECPCVIMHDSCLRGGM
jgi:hypothetical protein